MKLFKFFRSRWFIALIALSALSLAVWFIGPLFAFNDYKPLESEFSRIITIALIVALWLLIKVGRFINAKRKNIQFVAGIIKAPEPTLSADEQASQNEINTLKNNLTEALDVLKKTQAKGSEQKSLYQLPWYIIIGPPGAGKTTLLKNSNLRFPLSDQFGKDALRGVGGTRNCDWWFAEDAVLLDTAGRYTTQDSHQTVDSSAWLGFLQLLKKHRRRSPINGAIIAISISDLLEMDEASREKHADNIRNRVQELYKQIGILIPVYLIFTKCDRIAGFNAFFGHLSEAERGQVWGTTFSLPKKGSSTPEIATQLEHELSLLEKQLANQSIEKIEQEHNRENRSLIYTFPHQFNSLKQTVLSFTESISRSTRYESSSLLLRGVYFTSATQEGSPIDRVMGSLAHNFGLQAQLLTGTSGSGKGFFINRLLSNVIFAESGLASTNKKLESKLSWLQHGAVASIVLITLALSSIWFFSYRDNVHYVNNVALQTSEIHDAVKAMPSEKPDLMATATILDQIHSLPEAGSEGAMSGSLSFGLGQKGKLGSAANHVYDGMLETNLLPHLVKHLEDQLRNSADDSVYLYETLKTYLMLTNQGPFNAEHVYGWFAADWNNNPTLRRANAQRESLSSHLTALLKKQETWIVGAPAVDKQLVAKSRRVLTTMPLPEWAYSRIKSSLSNAEMPGFYFDQVVGRSNTYLFSRSSGAPLSQGIPGLFTQTGYKDFFLTESKQTAQHLAQESWVFGADYSVSPSGDELESLQMDVLKLYLNEYQQQWQRYLVDIRIAPMNNLDDAVQTLDKLSGHQSPLPLLVDAAAPEVNLDPENKDKSEKGFFEDAKDYAVRQSSSFGRAEKAAKLFTPNSQASLARQLVTTPFSRLIAFQEKSLTSKTVEDLSELYNKILPLAQGESDLLYEQRKQLIQTINKIKNNARRQPAPLNKVITSLTNSLLNIVGTSVCNHINSVWKNEVEYGFSTTVKNRYPLNRASEQEVTQEDFGLFFGPEGKLHSFFETYLAESVNTKGNTWRWVYRDNAPACISKSNLEQFRRASVIRKTFFRGQGLTPVINFGLKPNTMNPKIDRITLNIGRQIIRYAHEKPRKTDITWPSPSNSGHISLQITPAAASGASGFTFDGPWAIFKLFDRAQLSQLERSNRFLVTFNIQEREAAFELLATSTSNPFNLKELNSFQCPKNLL